MFIINNIEWKDSFFIDDNRKLLTNKELEIPGLCVLGHHINKTASVALPNHYHKNCFEIHYVVKGSITFTIKDNHYEAPGGAVFITFPGEIHGTGGNLLPKCEFYWFQIDCNQIDNLLGMKSDWALELMNEVYKISERVIKIGSSQNKVFQIIFDMIVKNATYSKLYCANAITTFLIDLIECDKKFKTQTQRDVSKSIEYVHSHYSENIDLEYMAKLSNMSLSHFKNVFKECTGSTPREFINKYKIDKSKNMLKEGFSITETAMELSFGSSNYFSNVFKGYTGYTPKEYVQFLKNKMPEKDLNAEDSSLKAPKKDL